MTEPTGRRFCPHCGYENGASAMFCTRCARPLRSAREFRFQLRGCQDPGIAEAGGSVCPGIDLEPAAVGGSTWRANPEQSPSVTGGAVRMPGAGPDPWVRRCRSCGLIMSGSVRIQVNRAYVLVRVNAEHLDGDVCRLLDEAFRGFNQGKRVIADLGSVSGADIPGLRTLVHGARDTRADVRFIGLRPELLRAMYGTHEHSAPGVCRSVNHCLEIWGLPPRISAGAFQ